MKSKNVKDFIDNSAGSKDSIIENSSNTLYSEKIINKVVSSAGIGIACLLPTMYTADLHKQEDYKTDYNIMSPYSDTSDIKPINEQVEDFLGKYEQIIFKYLGKVIDIERNKFGDDKSAIIHVSVNGKDQVIKRSISELPEGTTIETSLTVEGIIRGSNRGIRFHLVEPKPLSSEESELLENI